MCNCTWYYLCRRRCWCRKPCWCRSHCQRYSRYRCFPEYLCKHCLRNKNSQLNNHNVKNKSLRYSFYKLCHCMLQMNNPDCRYNHYLTILEYLSRHRLRNKNSQLNNHSVKNKNLHYSSYKLFHYMPQMNNLGWRYRCYLNLLGWSYNMNLRSSINPILRRSRRKTYSCTWCYLYRCKCWCRRPCWCHSRCRRYSRCRCFPGRNYSIAPYPCHLRSTD